MANLNCCFEQISAWVDPNAVSADGSLIVAPNPVGSVAAYQGLSYPDGASTRTAPALPRPQPGRRILLLHCGQRRHSRPVDGGCQHSHLLLGGDLRLPDVSRVDLSHGLLRLGQHRRVCADRSE